MLNEVPEHASDGDDAENDHQRRRQRHQQAAHQLLGAAILQPEGVRMVHDANQRVGDHAGQRPARRHDRGGRQDQEPDRDVLTLGDVALLARFLELLLCWIFCLLTVVLVFCHGAPLLHRQETHLRLHRVEPDHHPAAEAERDHRDAHQHRERHRRHEHLHLRDQSRDKTQRDVEDQ